MHKELGLNNTVDDMNVLFVDLNFKISHVYVDTCQAIRDMAKESSEA